MYVVENSPPASFCLPGQWPMTPLALSVLYGPTTLYKKSTSWLFMGLVSGISRSPWCIATLLNQSLSSQTCTSCGGSFILVNAAVYRTTQKTTNVTSERRTNGHFVVCVYDAGESL